MLKVFTRRPGLEKLKVRSSGMLLILSTLRENLAFLFKIIQMLQVKS